jgi:hypothetical protein
MLQVPPAAREVDPGVRGLRERSRTFSSDSNAPVITKQASDNSALTKWGSESEEEIQRKAKAWADLRDQQLQDTASVAQPKHAVMALALVLLFTRLTRFAGVSTWKSLGVIGFLGLLRGLWVNRAPEIVNKDLILHNKLVAWWPVLGNIGLIRLVLKESGVLAQVMMAKARNFNSAESSMFGGAHTFNTMDPVDREYVLRTNWKNYTKNVPGTPGFQEMFGEMLGRGIFAVDGEVRFRLRTGQGLTFQTRRNGPIIARWRLTSSPRTGCAPRWSPRSRSTAPSWLSS